MGLAIVRDELMNFDTHVRLLRGTNSEHGRRRGWTLVGGDHLRPTFNGSMLVHGSPGHPRCHSFLTAGVWHYLVDCTHGMGSRQVAAPDWDTTRFGRMDAHGVVKGE